MEEASAGPSGADMKKKPMLDQVCEAIKVLGKPKKGASVLAIKKYILNAFEESEHARIALNIKKALAKGEEAGLLTRPAYCKNCVGATGSFLLKTEKSKTIDKPQKLPGDQMKNRKKLYKQEDSEVVKKPIKPKTTKAKNSKKEENENKDSNKSEDIFRQSTPKKSGDSEVEQKGAKPQALKKTAKSIKKDGADITTLKKHASDSDLTDVKKETVKHKNLKETSKTVTKNKKPGKSATLKETEKAPPEKNEAKKKHRKVLKSYNSDSVLL